MQTQTENKRNYMTQQEKCEAYEINGARWWHPENCVRTRSFQRARFDLCAAELHHTVIDIYICIYISHGNLSSATTKLHDHTLRQTTAMWMQKKYTEKEMTKENGILNSVHMKSRKMPTHTHRKEKRKKNHVVR